MFPLNAILWLLQRLLDRACHSLPSGAMLSSVFSGNDILDTASVFIAPHRLQLKLHAVQILDIGITITQVGNLVGILLWIDIIPALVLKCLIICPAWRWIGDRFKLLMRAEAYQIFGP